MTTAGAASGGGVCTAEELAELSDDGSRFELIEGVLQEMPPAGFDHGLISATVASHLDRFVREHALGRVVGAETGFVVARDPDTVLAPDAAFIRADRIPPPGQRHGFAALAPDLVVEVVSPTDRAAAVADKALRWIEAGTCVVWVLYPDRRLVAEHLPDGTVHLRQADDALDGGDVLPGFRVVTRELFE
ncbi:MAG: Uma2 family endonuclease [Acidimicrobiales bacterium]